MMGLTEQKKEFTEIIVKNILTEAAHIARNPVRSSTSVSEKTNRFDLVTETDVRLEKFIVDELRAHFPQDRFVTEEGEAHLLDPDGKGDWTWVIDPLDGTTNFVHQLQHYSISVALCKGREPVAGFIYDLTRDDLYWAMTGRGAWLGEKKLRVSATGVVEEALVATGFTAEDWEEEGSAASQVNGLFGRTRSVRITGSSCLDLANIAAGRLDGFYHYNLKPWDLLAGVLLVREAGGTVSTLEGNRDVLTGSCCVATNGQIHQTLSHVIGGGDR
jgi:myo-inositol-1(or 4)-monophosphatase